MGTLITAAAVLITDQLTKYAVAATLHPHESRIVIPRFLYLTSVQNRHGAFGLFGAAPLLLIAASVVGLMIVHHAARPLLASSHTARIGFGALAGGALSNMLDRLWHGYVFDFLDVRVWPVFNAADSCITLGLGMLLFANLKAGSRAGLRRGARS